MGEHVMVCQHVAHEHAGNFGPALERHGFAQCVVDFSADPAARPSLGDAAGLLVMGGPMNVDDTRRYPIFRTPAAHGDALIGPFSAAETVFHWHGDTFDLPAGAVLLARSDVCAHQAFHYRRRAYGLQFHVETTPEMIASWLAVPENQAELAALSPVETPNLAVLRSESRRHAARLADLCAQLGDAFCDLLRARSR